MNRLSPILKNEIVFNVGWNFLGNILSKFAILITNIIIAFIFTKEEYGLSGFIRSNINLFITFGAFGFGIAATKFMAQTKEKEERCEYAAIIRIASSIPALLISLICFFFAGKIALYANNLEIESSIRISSIAILFLALNSVQIGLLNGLRLFKVLANITFSSSFVTAVATIFSSQIWRVEGYSIGLVIGALFSWMYSLYHLKKLDMLNNTLKYFSKNSAKKYLDVLRISVPAIISGISILPANWFSNILILRAFDGARKFAVYNAAFNITVFTTLIIGIIGQVLLPYAISKYSEKDTRFENINYYLPWLIGVVLSIPMMLVPELFSLVYGNKYIGEEFNKTIIFLAFNNILISQRQGISKNFIVSGKMWISFWGNTFWGIILVLILYNIEIKSSTYFAFAYFVAYLGNSIIILPVYIKMRLFEKQYILSKLSLVIIIISFLALALALFCPFAIRIISLIILIIVMIYYILKKYAFRERNNSL